MTPTPPTHHADRSARASRPWRSSSAIRLGSIALLLLVLAAAVLAGLTHDQLRDMRQDSERTRAQLMAESLSQRISHAVDIGIPFEALVGVDALFNQRLGAHPDIQSIALVQSNGEVFKSVAREQPGHAAAGTAADAPIVVRGITLGAVRLTLRETGAGAFARSAAALLIPTVLLLATLAFLAARFSEAHGPQLRNHAVRLATRAIAGGRYDRSVVVPNRRGFDLRAQQLSHAVRGVHETLVRVRRLIASLRQTEPQAHRREYLDRLLSDAEGSNRFAEHGLVQIRVVAAEAQTFWASLLMALSAAALPGMLLSQTTSPMTQSPALQATVTCCLWLASAAVAGWLTQQRRWHALSVLFAACVGLGALALGLATGVLAPLSDRTLWVGTALGCGAMAGAVLVACTAVEQAAHRQGQAHAMPRWHAASLGAWLGAAIWLGPALGAVASTALGPLYGVLALTLPILCAGFLLLRWNEPRSPWRNRIRDHAASLATTAATHGGGNTRPNGGAGAGVTLAAGLLAAQGLVVSTAGAQLLGNTVLACALGLGVIAGLLVPHRGRRAGDNRDTSLLAVAAALNALTLVVPATFVGHAPMLAVAGLLTAYLLGRAVTTTQRLLHLSPTAWLVGGTVGAVGSMAIAAGSLATGSIGLAASLALAWSAWRTRRMALTLPARKDHDAA
ncbi:MAG: hypothetical protein KKB95_13620 [Gammaproteobacteria bacterium]|nr:hypothetical protein [Gammaproteobacteria bacterium]MBU1507851.1 hypothetical protein [Gammaproteobacteria bacterium]MBU2122105.1 hypothetical protein [Gammaproteobacteria bacterium]MBU2173065.1 hypothetical protein [Gammaproteobacteria bacterium]MBU2203032.1 hypothetical protein [Gammaproteobacteria bacterium]